VNLVIVGAADEEHLAGAVAAFEAAGFDRIDKLDGLRDTDLVLGVADGGAELLREADRRGIKYVLVHDGVDDGHDGGTYERAHHRIESDQREELADHLHGRDQPLVTCLAFGYKNGVPSEAALLIDARFLDNPYWVPDLRERTGRDPAVNAFVMGQPAAKRLLDDIERMVRELVPLYQEKGRMHVVVAFGCTGGQHRSVVLASELAQRLGDDDGFDVDFVTRDLD
jgi:hypothetical protein